MKGMKGDKIKSKMLNLDGSYNAFPNLCAFGLCCSLALVDFYER